MKCPWCSRSLNESGYHSCECIWCDNRIGSEWSHHCECTTASLRERRRLNLFAHQLRERHDRKVPTQEDWGRYKREKYIGGTEAYEAWVAWRALLQHRDLARQRQKCQEEKQYLEEEGNP